MKLLKALLSETSNGIFTDRVYLDTPEDAMQFEKGYERLARLVYPDLTVKKGHDPSLKMDVTLAYVVPSDLHFRYIETTGELFFDRKIFQGILQNKEVRAKLGKLWNISPDPEEVFRRYGATITKVNI